MTSSAVIRGVSAHRVVSEKRVLLVIWYKISDTGHEHPGIVAVGHYSSDIIAPWKTIGQNVVNMWWGRPLETRGPRTKCVTSQHCCVRSSVGNGMERVRRPVLPDCTNGDQYQLL